MPHGSCKLVADRMDISRQNIQQDEPYITREKCNLFQKWRCQEHNCKAGQRRQQAGGKNASFVCTALQSVSDDTVGDPHRSNRDDQIASLDQQICDTVFGAGEYTGIKWCQHKGEEPGAEGTYTK